MPAVKVHQLMYTDGPLYIGGAQLCPDDLWRPKGVLCQPSLIYARTSYHRPTEMGTLAGNSIQNAPLDIKYEREHGLVHTSPILPSPSKDLFVLSDEERKLVRKLDMRVMLTLAIIYLFACEYRILTIIDSFVQPCTQIWIGQISAMQGYKAFRKMFLEGIQPGICLTGRTRRFSWPT